MATPIGLDAVDAQALIDLLQKNGLPVKGLSIKDVNDPSTWVFQGPLTKDQIQQAIAIVQAALHPITVPPAVKSAKLRDAILLFTDDEFVALSKSQSPAVIRLRAAVNAETTFDPTAVYTLDFFTACVDDGVLTEKRAGEIKRTLNPPV